VSLDWINHPCAAAACCIKQSKAYPQCNGPDIPEGSLDCVIALQTMRLLGATAAGSANPVQTINTANSIVGRAVALIKHLAGAEPHGGWSQFLTAANKFKWSQITVAGHSRGSSYPPLVSKYFPARRVISVGGVADHWGAANQTTRRSLRQSGCPSRR